jgi:hypothetical protein
MTTRQRSRLQSAVYWAGRAAARLERVSALPYIRFLRLRTLRVTAAPSSLASNGGDPAGGGEGDTVGGGEAAPASDAGAPPAVVADGGATRYYCLPRPSLPQGARLARLDSVYYKHWALPFPHPRRPVPGEGVVLGPEALLLLLAPQAAALLAAVATAAAPLEPVFGGAADSTAQRGAAGAAMDALRRLAARVRAAAPPLTSPARACSAERREGVSALSGGSGTGCVVLGCLCGVAGSGSESEELLGGGCCDGPAMVAWVVGAVAAAAAPAAAVEPLEGSTADD